MCKRCNTVKSLSETSQQICDQDLPQSNMGHLISPMFAKIQGCNTNCVSTLINYILTMCTTDAPNQCRRHKGAMLWTHTVVKNKCNSGLKAFGCILFIFVCRKRLKLPPFQSCCQHKPCNIDRYTHFEVLPVFNTPGNCSLRANYIQLHVESHLPPCHHQPCTSQVSAAALAWSSV